MHYAWDWQIPVDHTNIEVGDRAPAASFSAANPGL